MDHCKLGGYSDEVVAWTKALADLGYASAIGESEVSEAEVFDAATV